MAIERRRTLSRYDDEGNYRITRTLSFKTPQVEQTIATWKTAKKRKPFKKRCTRAETGGFCATNFGIITVAVCFCYCIPPNLFPPEGERGHPQELKDDLRRLIVFALASMLSSLSLLFLWLTYVTDPGVIPRRSEQEIRMLTEGERNCSECKIIRPPRGKHCKYCNHCIEVFDHHCPYAGVCIGNGNYLFFCLLLLSGLISSIYVGVFSIWFLKENWPVGEESWEGLKVQLVIGLILTLVCGSIFLLIGHLSCYHVFIVVTGQTTNEWVKTKRSNKLPKYSSGFVDTPSKEPLLGTRLSQETTSVGDTRYSCSLDTKESYTPYDIDTSGDIDTTTGGESRFADL